MSVSHIGAATARVDGRAKVTGAATYAGEFAAPDLAFGHLATARIARGTILRIDAEDALRVAGVLAVLTHENRPALAKAAKAWQDDTAPEGEPYRPLYDDRILFAGQPVALVVAETAETARYAASLIRVDYGVKAHETDLESGRDKAQPARPPAPPRGDFAGAFAAAPVRHEADYVIPVEHHNPMELFATTAVHEGDGSLTLYEKTQGVQNVQRWLVAVLQAKPADIRVVSPFVGGAFGSALRPAHNTLLAAMAARMLKRSVRVVLTRRQMYALCYRPATIEHLAIGATADGHLTGIAHEAIGITSRHEQFQRNDTTWSGTLYESDSARYGHKLVPLDLPTPCDMRAPGATTGVYALECAMDEVAVALDMDPLELRRRTYSDRDHNKDVPFTSKRLDECYRQGAAAFGWERRTPAPRSMRDGKELVGWGVATGVWEALQQKMSARILLTANGHAEVSCATSDIGTGTYTIMSQLAADLLGLPLDAVTVRLGDSTLPQAPAEGGSWTAASVAHAIAAAADAIKADLLHLAQKNARSPLARAKPDEVRLQEGRIVHDAAGTGPSIVDLMRQAGVERIEREATAKPAKDDTHARNVHSAVFAEVKIDEQLGVIRVTRLVSAVAAGRILNPKTAGSQISGGLVWGIGMALHEETLIDHTLGRFLNADMAEYHIPSHADVPDLQVIFVEEPDNKVNPMGIKGVGEIGLVGVAAAIANAVYHATGKRVRDLPITLDKVMDFAAAAE